MWLLSGLVQAQIPHIHVVTTLVAVDWYQTIRKQAFVYSKISSLKSKLFNLDPTATNMAAI